ncbi:MAG: DUF1353 domain-containing protein [Deltaproteobacteria bacterium]|nr:MAG: DUF1353 domain-containing protein [Deltaproteobacteria bacterium]
MKRKEINIDLRLLAELQPETFFEHLKYFFFELKTEWETLQDLEYTLADGTKIVIEKGFKCDLCSIPPFLQSFISSHSSTVKAYILHDWMYKNDYLMDELGVYKARLLADNEMLRHANMIDPDKKRTNKLLYRGVRTFGEGVYERKEYD